VIAYKKKNATGEGRHPPPNFIKRKQTGFWSRKTPLNPGCASEGDFYCAAPKIQALGGWHLYWMLYH